MFTITIIWIFSFTELPIGRYISVLNKIMKLNVYCFIFLYALFKLKLIFNNTQKSIFIDNNIISPAFF